MFEVTARQAPTGKLFDAPPPTLRQIHDKTGDASKAHATDNLWVGGAQAFSVPRLGNDLLAYTTGKEYFAELIKAIPAANRVVYIAGWQVNWDAEFAPGKRLYDVLLQAVTAKPALKIYVMPWKHSSPVQTFDGETKAVLLSINEILKRQCVWVSCAASLADEHRMFYSHHQKLIVIDEETAYIGGMDVAYGRFDDATYNLKADAENRAANNRYNGCVPHLAKVKDSDTVDPNLMTGSYDTGWHPFHPTNRNEALAQIKKGAFQTPPGEQTLDPARQPRMPWQDVHMRIKGPSAADVARNFVIRWNSEGDDDNLPRLKLPPEPSADAQQGKCQVQVLRSAPAAMRAAEHNSLEAADKSRFPAPTGKHCEIALAMRNLINSAVSFIYIENQFFVSGFGSEVTNPDVTAPDVPDQGQLSGPASQVKGWTGYAQHGTHLYAKDADEAPKNFICELLGERINRSVMAGPKHPFHVIITLPVHPEGELNDGSVMTQVHWTMQSLVFGPFSLLNRVRRSLKARELKDKKVADWHKVQTDAGDRRYETIDLDSCRDYVTLLNLRNWIKLSQGYVTEQIYIHTKMMLVDDRFALLGSANINDRSLLGTRDSEIAVLISDTETKKHDIDGSGHVVTTRNFARALRIAVWKKLFGMTGGVRPAKTLEGAILQPANPANWKAIQQVADTNRDLYEAAFNFIPRSKSIFSTSENPGSASIWPRWSNNDGKLMGTMPFDDKFWDTPQQTANAAKLEGATGFIVSLPLGWTKGENNNLGYATALVADNTGPSANPSMQMRNGEPEPEVASAADPGKAGELS